MASTSTLENNAVAGDQGEGVADHQVAVVQVAVAVAESQVANTQVAVVDHQVAVAKQTPEITLADEESTFPIFRKFPIELRLKIWKLALPTEARYIEVHSEHPGYDPDPDVWTYHYTFKPVISPLLFVNHEANSVVTSQPPRGIPLQASPPGPAAVYYDPEVDVLCFRADQEDGTYEYWKWFADMGDEFMGRVKYMAMQSSYMSSSIPNTNDFSPDDYFSQAHMNKMVSLETLLVTRFNDEDEFKFEIVDGADVDLRQRGTIVGFVEDKRLRILPSSGSSMCML